MTDLSGLNTLGVPAEAAQAYRIQRTDDLLAVAGKLRGGAVLILGGGSNVVLPRRVETPVCLMRNRGIRASGRGEQVAVTAAAGENWHDLVRWSLARGLRGIENLALIPGSVGAAPVQNIGAYGVELAERFVSLQALDLETGRLQHLDRSDCAFGYRTSLFREAPGRFVILEITLALAREPGPVSTGYAGVEEELQRMGIARARPVDVAEAVIRVRRRKLPDPRRVPNVGSFFRNPVITRAHYQRLTVGGRQLKSHPEGDGVKLAAAELIAHCMKDAAGGWAGKDAPVRVWPRQPLVLTNPGRCDGARVLAVAEEIRRAVLERFGVRLTIEPDTFTG